MKILAFSEHFFPRIGGTVEYVHRTCENLQDLGNDVHLIIPGSEENAVVISDYPYKVTSLGVGWPTKGDPSRETRYRFCFQANQFIVEYLKSQKIDVIHVLFGLFLNEKLDIRTFRSMGIPCLTSVMNIPPQECSRSWPTDKKINYLADSLRLKAVAFKNLRRLRAHPYTSYIAVSQHTKRLLKEVLPKAQIDVVHHGCSPNSFSKTLISKNFSPRLNNPINLLTVGGWVPHKRQHIIPDIALRLRDAGLEFRWNIVGPATRIPRYQQAVIDAIEAYNLETFVKVSGAVPTNKLIEMYYSANLYVQPSTEEGFCMTALDAAAIGLPVIASPTGALPEIAKLSGGVLIQSKVEEVSRAIQHFINADLWENDVTSKINLIREEFSWEASAKQLEKIYLSVTNH